MAGEAVYEYDQFNHLVQVTRTEPLHPTYIALDRLVLLNVGTVTSYEYDLSSLIKDTRPGEAVYMAYDAINRLTEKGEPVRRRLPV